MYTNGVSGNYNSYSSTSSAASTKQATDTASKKDTSTKATEQAAVYEPTSAKTVTENAQRNSKADNKAIVSQLKADLAQRKQQLQNMVTKMLGQQANTWKTSQRSGGVDMYQLLRSGNFTADADTIAQAKADVADDGYWGVEQTSDRFLSFAKALSGGDSGKADELLAAFKKGFEQATGAWGSKLPDISQRTYDATVKKFEAWKNGTEI